MTEQTPTIDNAISERRRKLCADNGLGYEENPYGIILTLPDGTLHRLTYYEFHLWMTGFVCGKSQAYAEVLSFAKSVK
jgi:hypothetical protein